MATSAPNTTPDPRPTGDLEHLFRQKFAEAEVTPRAGLWEQLDHELLVEQNNTFRHRLSVHRWVAAACLLLLLSASGWALLHQWRVPASGLAAQRAARSTRPAEIAANAEPATNQANASRSAAPGSASQPATNAARAGAAAESPAVSNEIEVGASPRETLIAAYKPYAGAAASRNQATSAQAADFGSGRLVAGIYQAAGTKADAALAAGRYSGGRSGTLAAPAAGGYLVADNGIVVGWNGLAPRFANLRGGWLGVRPDTLKMALLAVPQPLVGALAAAQNEAQTPARQWRRLRVGGSYAAAAYSPNINFSRNNGWVKADLVTTALRDYYQDDAEVEYRRNLRAGLSQRVAITAAYALHKRWTLTSGVEATQQRASSATSYGFIDGRQVAVAASSAYPLSNRSAFLAVGPAPTRRTSYRYRTVAVPVEIRYGSTRPGVSLYAKVGAAVGLLLGSRSELDGSPEATRLYSLSSTDSPYRQVQTSVRGGAGVRYQPTKASWSLALGTTTETGLTTLNANPSQRGVNQSRPYSVGVEASVEFGSPKPAPVAR